MHRYILCMYMYIQCMYMYCTCARTGVLHAVSCIHVYFIVFSNCLTIVSTEDIKPEANQEG